MSTKEIEIPKEVLSREAIDYILARWQKKRRGLLGPLLFPNSCKRHLHRLEKFYVPHYLFTFHQSARSKIEVHYILIDGVCGFGAFTDTEPELCKEKPEAAVLPTMVVEEKAVAKAKDWLARWNLRRHTFSLRTPEILSSQIRIFHLPFWLAQYKRPSGKIDIEVVDGIRGSLEGGRTRYMIKQGMSILQGATKHKG